MTTKASAKPRSVGLRLRTNDQYGGWPQTAHTVPGVPGEFYPHQSTPLEDTGLSEADLAKRCADPSFPLELATTEEEG